MSWPAARKVSAADCAAATLGEADATAVGVTGPVEGGAEGGAEAGPLADAVAEAAGLLAAPAAELGDELHAVSSNAAAASNVPAAAVRPLRLVKVSMDSNPSNFVSGSASHAASMTSDLPPWLEPALPRGISTARSE